MKYIFIFATNSKVLLDTWEIPIACLFGNYYLAINEQKKNEQKQVEVKGINPWNKQKKTEKPKEKKKIQVQIQKVFAMLLLIYWLWKREQRERWRK